MENNSSTQKNALSSLPTDIKDWILSDSVLAITISINSRAGLWGSELSVIPSLITRLVLRQIKPVAFLPELIRQLPMLTVGQASGVAEQIRDRILQPIRNGLRNSLGINYLEITTVPPAANTPVVRSMPVEKPAVAVAPKPPVVPSRPAAPAQPAPLRARTMEMQKPSMSDIRKPVARPAPATPPQRPAQPPTPSARVVPVQQGSFFPPVARPQSPQKQPNSAPARPVTPTPQAETIVTKKPFGLAEAVPTPPPAHDVGKYEDHHPMVE